jgi:serine/threonine-protein kinase
MPTNPITSESSLKNRPALRWGLLALWAAIVIYTLAVLGSAISPQISQALNSNLIQTLLNIPALLQIGFDYGIDLLVVIGFSLIGGLLVVHRSDDWFAIFTSAFLITFGWRITNLANLVAQMPGYQAPAGLIIAMGDIGIVLFSMLFPDGKFSPRWMKFVAPFIVIALLGIYVFPSALSSWVEPGSVTYLAIASACYASGILTIIHRYSRSSTTLAQKRQIRWAFLGTMGPLLWFVLFMILPAFIPAMTGTTVLAASVKIISQLLGIFLFLMLPVCVMISIVRTKLFDIDLIINRSLVYGGLTLALGLAFALVLGSISLLFKNVQQNDQSLLVATICSVAAGALFQPARKRLQRFVDRFFYRIQVDYQKTPVEMPSFSQPAFSGATLSSYRGLKLIGRGGMAEVYCATSPTNGRMVAIKVLPAALAGDEQFRKRFLREAQIISGLEHPNIVRILDFGDENGSYYIVMEFLSGSDLNYLLKQQKQIALPEIISLLRGVANALDYAHKQGLVHRDIKPSNVMLDPSTTPARAVLTDFGIAKITNANTRITSTGVLGTFDYIAPEQIQASAEVDGRADVYALGVMIYQMLTGHLPFERPNPGALLLAHLTAPPPDARELVSDLPRHAAYALQRAMAKKPADRYPSAGAFISALESV